MPQEKFYPSKIFVSKSILSQCIVAGAVMMIAASCGMPAGFTAILLPQLKQTENATFAYEHNLASWFVSVYPAMIPIGTLISGFLMDKFGRRSTLMLATVPLAASWLGTCLARSMTEILISRIVIGISVGLTAVPGQVLISEISEPKLRGILSGAPYVSYSIGVLAVYVMGFYFAWKVAAFLCVMFPLVGFLWLLILPESPVWLAKQNRENDAYESLCWLRNNLIKAREECDLLVLNVRRDDETRRQNQQKSFASSLKAIFTERKIVRPFLIINGFNLLQILSGTHLIIFYAVEILHELFERTGQGATPARFEIAILTAVTRFLFAIIGSMLLYVIGRRQLALASSTGTALFSLLIAAISLNAIAVDRVWLAVAVLGYIASNTLGFLILPTILLGELYPLKYRALAAAITLTVYNLFLSFVTKLYPLLKHAIRIEGVFLVFGLSSLLATAFFYFCLPETRNKSLLEIEESFETKKVFIKSPNESQPQQQQQQQQPQQHHV